MRISNQCKTCKFEKRSEMEWPCNSCWTGANKWVAKGDPKGTK